MTHDGHDGHESWGQIQIDKAAGSRYFCIPKFIEISSQIPKVATLNQRSLSVDLHLVHFEAFERAL